MALYVFPVVVVSSSLYYMGGVFVLCGCLDELHPDIDIALLMKLLNHSCMCTALASVMCDEQNISNLELVLFHQKHGFLNSCQLQISFFIIFVGLSGKCIIVILLSCHVCDTFNDSPQLAFSHVCQPFSPPPRPQHNPNPRPFRHDTFPCSVRFLKIL
jgi:hypothetical protein